MKKILVVVDYQEDFINGKLAINGAEKIYKNIQNLIDNKDFEHIIYTFDTHTKEEYEKSEEKQLFPEIHCEFKKFGWNLYKIKPRNVNIFNKIINEILLPFNNITIDNESFFTKNKFNIWDGNKIYKNWFYKNFNPEKYEIYICGVATNYCVLENVKGLIDKYKVFIVENAIKGIQNFPNGDKDISYENSINFMKNNNCKFI